MNRAVISLVDPANAPEDVRKAAEAHLAKGYRLTNEKRTLLHNAVAFEALEGMSYAVSAEMKKFTGHRAANLFQYAISLENDCLVCSTYYRKAMADLGLEHLDESEFTPDEALLVEYARAIVRNHKFIPASAAAGPLRRGRRRGDHHDGDVHDRQQLLQRYPAGPVRIPGARVGNEVKTRGQQSEKRDLYMI